MFSCNLVYNLVKHDALCCSLIQPVDICIEHMFAQQSNDRKRVCVTFTTLLHLAAPKHFNILLFNFNVFSIRVVRQPSEPLARRRT